MQNINVGRGTIVFTSRHSDDGYKSFKSGWVLPGGRFTQSEAIATEAAKWIDGYFNLKSSNVNYVQARDEFV